jgi:hypothetical protein
MISSELRQRLVEAYAREHDGVYDAVGFFEEVRKAGKKHPAYEWFEWDVAKAAFSHNVQLAHKFAQGLKIRFEVEVITSKGPRTYTREAPSVFSPDRDRRDGAYGYVVAHAENYPMRDLCGNASNALSSWLRRYQACLPFVGEPATAIERLIEKLRIAGEAETSEAAE